MRDKHDRPRRTLTGTRVQFGTGWHWIDGYRWTPVDANTVIQAWAFDIPDRPAQFGGPVHFEGALTYRRVTDLPAPTPPRTSTHLTFVAGRDEESQTWTADTATVYSQTSIQQMIQAGSSPSEA